MTATTTDRIDELERLMGDTRERLIRVEARPASAAPVSGAAAAWPAPAAGRAASLATPELPAGLAPRPAPRPDPRRVIAEAHSSARQLSLDGSVAAGPAPAPTPAPAPARVAAAKPALTVEQLLGGRVLAWVGGAAILAGLAFLFALGVSSGWLDESRRCLIGALASGALIGVGSFLQERRGRTTAALAAIGTGIAGLFLAVGFATSIYDLIPAVPGAVLAAGVGALGVSLALRWNASAIAGLGLIGAVLSPSISEAIAEPTGLVLLFVATACAVAVTLHRRWGWLGVAIAATATPQWLGALALTDDTYGLPATLLTLIGFGALGVLSAVGRELREPLATLRTSSLMLQLATSAVLAIAGYALIDELAPTAAAIAWLGALAAAHLAAWAGLRRSDRLGNDLTVLVLVVGAVLAEVTYTLSLDGPVRAAGWIVAVLVFAWLARRTLATPDRPAALTGLGVHVMLATIGVSAELDVALSDGGELTLVAGLLLAAGAGAAFGAARLVEEPRQLLDVLGFTALVLLAVLTLDGLTLTLVWAVFAAGLATLAQRTDDPTAAGAAVVHLAGALGWCLIDQAAPIGLGAPLDELGRAAAGLAGVGLAGAWAARELRRSLSFNTWALPLATGAGLVALYLASLTAVAFQPGSGDDMQGQLQLTALWAATGVAALIVGLSRDDAALRTAALGLLALSAGKLFLVDLATLAAAWRVIACIAVGLLLLVAAYAHARLRPEAAPDFREAETTFR
ncbi:hypothetical protein DSM112329_05011 [Paraconexibacter sp. AEG42_29]|uniref:DUF2339 domain-containing protein n=1 Tax=Paraconexibacter sp. AEG42_29 TaxID=2997339 RepID=A0AAU7B2L6_9ACTN